LLRLEREFPNQVLIINYNELIEKTLQQVERLFDFCELDLHSQSIRFLERADDPERIPNREEQLGSVYSVFHSRSKDLDWQGELSDSVIDYISNDLKSSPLSTFLSVACR